VIGAHQKYVRRAVGVGCGHQDEVCSACTENAGIACPKTRSAWAPRAGHASGFLECGIDTKREANPYPAQAPIFVGDAKGKSSQVGDALPENAPVSLFCRADTTQLRDDFGGALVQ
jgi:hypothetical protein